MAELDVVSPPARRFEMEPLAAAPPRETNGAAPAASPLQTQESFTNYCLQVQGRLRERAAVRRQFLQAAYDRLTGLLHAALAVDDQPLYNELWQHRAAAKELLEAAQRAVTSPALEERARTGLLRCRRANSFAAPAFCADSRFARFFRASFPCAPASRPRWRMAQRRFPPRHMKTVPLLCRPPAPSPLLL